MRTDLPLRRVLAVGFLGVLAAACSQESSRFLDPFTNPFQKQAEVTNATPAPSTAVESRPLAAAPTTVPATPAPVASTTPATPPTTGTIVRRSGDPWTVHVVAPGETLYSLSRRYKKSRVEIARANQIGEWTPLRVGQRLTIPGVVATQPKSQLRVETKSKPQTRAEVKPIFAPPPKPAAPETVAAVKPAAEPEPTPVAAAPIQFRWPVQGRIISAFGPKPNGQHNDGVNLAVPEGTPIKAAEDGLVAYAGNELKGYGNLVLIRHANGWVTAYAHASQLLVKRGETVKRGQTIARAGRTGGVDVPQLHFEIRKGSTPVDPTTHLTAG
jgi:murein DD-endopeptidase MepM/ murein hydrolase activator NlpD